MCVFSSSNGVLRVNIFVVFEVILIGNRIMLWKQVQFNTGVKSGRRQGERLTHKRWIRLLWRGSASSRCENNSTGNDQMTRNRTDNKRLWAGYGEVDIVLSTVFRWKPHKLPPVPTFLLPLHLRASLPLNLPLVSGFAPHFALPFTPFTPLSLPFHSLFTHVWLQPLSLVYHHPRI